MGTPLEYVVPSELLALFHQQAQQKIDAEGWAKQGRNIAVKVQNFVQCWTTEEAFKQILIQRQVWFRNRGLYFGDAEGAGADFVVKVSGKEVSIGLRSISTDSLQKWKSVAYPDDRFRLEKEKIADHHVVCHLQDNTVSFHGLISKETLLEQMGISRRIYSPKNQEYFRVVDLSYFKFSELLSLLENMEKI